MQQCRVGLAAWCGERPVASLRCGLTLRSRREGSAGSGWDWTSECACGWCSEVGPDRLLPRGSELTELGGGRQGSDRGVAVVSMGCGASTSNPPLSATKMRLISEMPDDKRRACEQVFSSLDKDGNGSITLEDSIWAKPFLDAHDIDGDGRVTLVRLPTPLAYRALLLSCSRTANAQTARFYSA